MRKCPNIIFKQFESSCCGKKEMDVYNDKENKKHCWKCYEKSFIAHENKWAFDLNGLFEELKNSEKYKDVDVYFQETFLSNNGGRWNKKRRFREFLISKKVSDFVYIKGFLDENKKTYPIVVGKTSMPYFDVNFSVKPEHGTARYLLSRNKELSWNCEEVIIIIPKKKGDSLNVEKQIQIDYCLFGS
ncbi:MAG: hypothetical protein FWH20_07900 [Oscillospiraceae bacterium]|nr:hypothetical protein [Oscillospiraceae bacterium]